MEFQLFKWKPKIMKQGDPQHIEKMQIHKLKNDRL